MEIGEKQFKKEATDTTVTRKCAFIPMLLNFVRVFSNKN